MHLHVSVISLDLSHWPTPRGRVYTLEATAYALLALVKAKVSMSYLSVSTEHAIKSFSGVIFYGTTLQGRRLVAAKPLSPDNTADIIVASIWITKGIFLAR